MKKKTIYGLLVVAMSASFLAGCGKTASKVENTQTKSATTDITTYRVVTASSYAPFCYLNENNELDGFDVDIMKAIDTYDESIAFTYEWCDWASMLPGLDAGRYDMCVYELGDNKERRSIYHYGEVPYSNSAGAGIITTDKHEDWKNFDDIAAVGDAKVGCIVGSSFTKFAEDYLEEHPDAFKISYYDTEIDAVLEDVVNGRIDCTINDGAVAMMKAKEDGTAEFLQVTGYVTESSPVWIIYPKNDLGDEMSSKIDDDIRALYKDGTLANVAVKWFGDDDVITSLESTGYFN